jgi:replicative DNA helicase
MIEAEQSLIVSMVMNPNCLTDVLDMVGIEDFTSNKHKSIVDAVIRISNAGETVDLFSVADKAGELDYLSELATGAHQMNHKAAAAVVHRESTKRKALANLAQATQDVLAADTVEDQIAAISSVSDGIETKGDDFQTYTELFRDALRRLDDRMTNKAPEGLKTGFPAIDERLMGISPTDLIIVAGRPSMGKTTYAMNIGENVAASGRNVLVFSLEMSKEQLLDRSMASRTGIPMKTLKTGLLEDQHHSMLQAGAAKIINKYNLNIVDKAALHVDHAANIAKKFNNTRKLDLIIVDYLQLMTATANGRFEEISVISRSLKAIAKNLNTPVIALSQLSREVDKRPNKRPVNSDLRESGQIEQDADIIQFLYRDEVYDPNSSSAGIAEVITTKFRNGEIGTDILKSELHVSRFANADFKHSEMPAQEVTSGYTPYKKG